MALKFQERSQKVPTLDLPTLIDTGLRSASLRFSDSKHQPQIVRVLGGLAHRGVKGLSIVEPHLYEKRRCASSIEPPWLPHSPRRIISGTASSLKGIAYIQQRHSHQFTPMPLKGTAFSCPLYIRNTKLQISPCMEF